MSKQYLNVVDFLAFPGIALTQDSKEKWKRVAGVVVTFTVLLPWTVMVLLGLGLSVTAALIPGLLKDHINGPDEGAGV